jgi:hypothetical protein
MISDEQKPEFSGCWTTFREREREDGEMREILAVGK